MTTNDNPNTLGEHLIRFRQKARRQGLSAAQERTAERCFIEGVAVGVILATRAVAARDDTMVQQLTAELTRIRESIEDDRQ